MRVAYTPEKRIVVVKESFVKGEAELKLNAFLLVQYLNRLNEVRMEVDWKEVEDVLVKDFINLDSFIHKIN